MFWEKCWAPFFQEDTFSTTWRRSRNCFANWVLMFPPPGNYSLPSFNISDYHCKYYSLRSNNSFVVQIFWEYFIPFKTALQTPKILVTISPKSFRARQIELSIHIFGPMRPKRHWKVKTGQICAICTIYQLPTVAHNARGSRLLLVVLGNWSKMQLKAVMNVAPPTPLKTPYC